MKIVHCRDLGFACDQEIRAETEEEVLRQAAEHAHTVHGIQVTPEVAVQVESHIQDLSDSDLEQVVGGSGSTQQQLRRSNLMMLQNSVLLCSKKVESLSFKESHL
jgi:predicted small metal-binding protein